MNQVLVGTRNSGKIREVRALLSDVAGVDWLTYSECPFEEIEETGETFLENALLKANGIARQTGLPVLAEDSGLEVAALGGEPGTQSARYAGFPVDYARNNALLLERLEGEDDRRARFVTVAALYLTDGQTFVSTGTLRGSIAVAPTGTGGFGYDPLFIPQGHTRTLAELSLEEKNRISHRMRAMRRMREILRDLISEGELAV